MKMVTRLVTLILLVALTLACNSGGGDDKKPTAATPAPQTYSGPINGTLIYAVYTVPTTSAPNWCYGTRTFSGTLRITLTLAADGTVTGTGDTSGTETETGMTVSPLCQSTFGSVPFNWSRPLSGSTASLAFSGRRDSVPGTPTSSGGTTTSTSVTTVDFAGALSGGTITGTLTVAESGNAVFPHPQVASTAGSGTASFSVTLR